MVDRKWPVLAVSRMELWLGCVIVAALLLLCLVGGLRERLAQLVGLSKLFSVLVTSLSSPHLQPSEAG